MSDDASPPGLQAPDPGWELIPSDLLGAEMEWQPVEGETSLYAAVAVGRRWKLRLNDFPDEAAFTLFGEDRRVADFDQRPTGWHFGES